MPCLLRLAGSRGQSDTGQQLLAEAFAAMQRTEERYWEAELHRLQGELLGQEAERPQRQVQKRTFSRPSRWLVVSKPSLGITRGDESGAAMARAGKA